MPHTTVHDVEAGPFDSFDADYTRHAGQRHPASPEHADIWAASNQGAGTQTVAWEIEDGNWSVVVMNADGSLGVDADIRANELGGPRSAAGRSPSLEVCSVRIRRPGQPDRRRRPRHRGRYCGCLGLAEQTKPTHETAPGLCGPGAFPCV